MKRLLIIIMVILPIINFSQEKNFYSNLSILNWLAGEWEYKTGKSITVEKWKILNDRTFEGFANVQKIDAEAPYNSEELRMLNMRGDIFYMAKVDHNEMPIPFKLVFSDADKFVFENPAHDFPKRITYFKHGADSMVVRVGKLSDSKPKSFELYFSRIN